jgi:predicted nucleic acid-binding protein
MNVVDSSAWLEYFTDSPHADNFAEPIEDIDNLLVPTVCILEVFRTTLRQRDENAALQAVALMEQGTVAVLDTAIALSAAKFGSEYKLPLAVSIILATARTHGALLWTQDADFKGIDGVKYFPKRD